MQGNHVGGGIQDDYDATEEQSGGKSRSGTQSSSNAIGQEVAMQSTDIRTEGTSNSTELFQIDPLDMESIFDRVMQRGANLGGGTNALDTQMIAAAIGVEIPKLLMFEDLPTSSTGYVYKTGSDLATRHLTRGQKTKALSMVKELTKPNPFNLKCYPAIGRLLVSYCTSDTQVGH